MSSAVNRSGDVAEVKRETFPSGRPQPSAETIIISAIMGVATASAHSRITV